MEINTENQNKKKLGRGLGSLLGGSQSANEGLPAAETVGAGAMRTSTAVDTLEVEKKIWSISIDKLVPGQYQPRKNFEKHSLDELAQSIKENGILQPIVVRKRSAGGFEIIAGERRWRAAQLAGLHEVPALIKNITDKDALQLAIIENVQREDLDPIEEAESYQRLMEEFSYSQAQVAEKVGKERSTVANALRLISLPAKIKEMLIEKKISSGHAKALLSVENKSQQEKLARAVETKQISVRQLESMIKLSKTQQQAPLQSTAESALKASLPDRLALELAQQMQKNLGTKVQIKYKAGKGEITIHFYSDEQLNMIYEKVIQP